MNRLLTKSLLFAVTLGSLAGCGGSGATTSANASQFAGTYSAAYTRSTGSMTLAVAANGLVTITIVDGVSGNFVGSGSANHVGGFYIECTGQNSQKVTVKGTLRGSGLGRTAAGIIEGSIALSYTANLVSAPDATLYANHYTGYYEQGVESGDWFGDVDAQGNFSGQLLVGPTPNLVPISGNVYTNGSFSFASTSGSIKYTAQGNFHLSTVPQGIMCDGLLKGTTTGTFSGHISEAG